MKNLPIIGAIIAAIAASLCCLGPALLGAMSIAGIGIGGLHKYRPLFVVLSLVLVSIGFFLVYGKKKDTCEDGTCHPKNTSKMNKVILWLATLAVAFFIAYPYLDISHSETKSEKEVRNVAKVLIPVEMDCDSCAKSIERAVLKMEGIAEVKADYKKGEVYVEFDSEKTKVDDITKTIENIGYQPDKQNIKYLLNNKN